jgi:pyruvate-formate lyase-activating enzyme
MNPTVNIVFKSLYSCAHKCPFCHVLAIPRNVSYMSTAAVKATFDEIEARYAGSRVELELSGGEFTLRKDAVELVRYLRSKRIRWSSLVLDTMGVPLADPALCEALGALFDKVNVSVHSPDPERHARISGSTTDFDRLQAALANLFRYFPAVFTNTAICVENYDALDRVAAMVLDARAARPATPLFCLYYLPVYREYGPAVAENAWRLHAESNADLLPDGAALPAMRAEFRRARARLAAHGVPAVLRDFNVPACVYGAVADSLPENAFGLANFMSGCYFTDYAHPLAGQHTLEGVYPSMSGRVKPEGCAACVAADVCAGIPQKWLERGYRVAPIDQRAYERELPVRLLNQVLFAIVHDAVALQRLLAPLAIDWTIVADALFARLSAPETDAVAARRRVRDAPLDHRLDALFAILAERRGDAAELARRLAPYRAAMTADALVLDHV